MISTDLKCFICENNLLQQDTIYLLINDFHYEWEFTWDCLKYSPLYLGFFNFNEKQSNKMKMLNLNQKSLIFKKLAIHKTFNENFSSYSNSISAASEDINIEKISSKS